jgi:hypothetical protein
MSIVADLTGAVTTADTSGLVAASACVASATTRVASTRLPGAVGSAAGAFAAAEARVVFAVPAAVGCAGPVAGVEFSSDPPAAVVAAAPAGREEPVGERVFAPPVLATAPGSAERVAGCDDPDGVEDADIDLTWLIGDFFEVPIDPGAVDGAEPDVPDTAPVPECAAPADEVESAGVVDAESEDDSEVDGWAEATQGVAASAVPMPSATANAPTRAMCFA